MSFRKKLASLLQLSTQPDLPASMRTETSALPNFPARCSPFLVELAEGLFEALPGDKRGQLISLSARVEGAPDGQDEVRAYIALDWLLRQWLPTWLSLAPDPLTEHAERLQDSRRVESLETAAAAGKMISPLDGCRHATAKTVKETRGSIIGNVSVWAAQNAAETASRTTAGNAVVDAVSRTLADACEAAHAEMALKAVHAVAFAAALDGALSVADHVVPTTNSDTVEIVLRNMAPVGAETALESVVSTLQDSAIRLYESLLDPAENVPLREVDGAMGMFDRNLRGEDVDASVKSRVITANESHTDGSVVPAIPPDQDRCSGEDWRSWLSDGFANAFINEFGTSVVPFENTVVICKPSVTSNGDELLSIEAPILLDMPASPAVYELIAVSSREPTFGAFVTAAGAMDSQLGVK